MLHIAKIIPDDGSEGTTRNALGIATNYAVMDYFDQYTFARTSAQMIAEVGYTELMTIKSTAISAPFIVAGSYAVQVFQDAAAAATIAAEKLAAGATSEATKIGYQLIQQFSLKTLLYVVGKQALIGTIKETVEEIVVDGFFETAIQSAVRMAGGPDDAGHWISTLFTSLRETANFNFLIGSSSQSQQGFAGQVQIAMDINTGFQSTVASMLAQNEEMTLAQIAAENEQFLTVEMMKLKNYEDTFQNSKITLGRLLTTGLFTGLALLTPSLAGFNMYGITKLIGGISSKFSAKAQNRRLAARNSAMLFKDAVETEKQKIEMGKKPITSQSEDKLPDIEAPVSTMPEGINPLVTRNPIELELGTAVGATSSGFVYMSPFGDPNRDVNRRDLDSFTREKNADKVQKVKDHLAKIEEMKNTEEDRDKNIVEQLEEKKQTIFDKVELFDFNPHDPDLQYPLTDNDNIQSILFKTLLNLIYKNKESIETTYRGDTRFEFTDDGKINYKIGSTHLIHRNNLGVLLGISGKTVTTYLSNIDNQDLTALTIRKMRVSLNSLFDHIRLRKAQVIVSDLIENYIDLRYSGNDKFIVKLLTLIDDYADIGILREESISEDILKNSNKYLRRFRDKTTHYEKRGKYFNLLVNIYISGESSFGFTDSDKFIAFKKEVTNLAYTSMSKDLKLIKETHTSKTRFITLCETLAALTKFRYRFPKYFSETTPIKISNENTKGYYTLADLSTEMSGRKDLLNSQLQTGAPSHQLFSIIDLLDIGISKNMDGCSFSKHLIESYLKSKQWENRDYGNIVHPIYEQFLIEYLESKGIKVGHEKIVSLLRDTIIDNVIERKTDEERRNGIKSNFEKYIEDRQNVLTITDAINLISVDYTFSSEWDLFIKPKLDKAYQSKDRFLIIVLLGQKSDATMQKLNDKLQDAVRADDGSKHLENVRIITSKQYGEFLGFNRPSLSLSDKNFKQRFDYYQNLCLNVFHNLGSLFGALKQNARADRWLAGHNEDWIQMYRPQP